MVMPVGMGIFGSYLQGQEEARRREMAGLQGLSTAVGLGGALQQQQQAAQMNPIALQLAQAQLANVQNPTPEYRSVGDTLLQIPRGGMPQPVFSSQPKPQPMSVGVEGQPGATQAGWGTPGQSGFTPVGPAKLGAPPMSVAVKVDQKTGESFAKEIAPMMTESRAAAVGAVGAVDTAQRINNAIAKGNVTLGPTATLRNKADQITQLLGVGGATTEERLVNTRNVIRGLSQFAVAARKQLKGQGQVSDYEGKLIQRAEAGEIDDFTLPELKDFVSVTERLAKKTYGEHQRMLGVMKSDERLTGFVPFYEAPLLPGGGQQGGNVRKYNPQTGRIE